MLRLPAYQIAALDMLAGDAAESVDTMLDADVSTSSPDIEQRTPCAGSSRVWPRRSLGHARRSRRKPSKPINRRSHHQCAPRVFNALKLTPPWLARAATVRARPQTIAVPPAPVSAPPLHPRRRASRRRRRRAFLTMSARRWHRATAAKPWSLTFACAAAGSRSTASRSAGRPRHRGAGEGGSHQRRRRAWPKPRGIVA